MRVESVTEKPLIKWKEKNDADPKGLQTSDLGEIP